MPEVYSLHSMIEAVAATAVVVGASCTYLLRRGLRRRAAAFPRAVYWPGSASVRRHAVRGAAPRRTTRGRRPWRRTPKSARLSGRPLPRVVAVVRVPRSARADALDLPIASNAALVPPRLYELIARERTSGEGMVHG